MKKEERDKDQTIPQKDQNDNDAADMEDINDSEMKPGDNDQREKCRYCELQDLLAPPKRPLSPYIFFS